MILLGIWSRRKLLSFGHYLTVTHLEEDTSNCDQQTSVIKSNSRSREIRRTWVIHKFSGRSVSLYSVRMCKRSKQFCEMKTMALSIILIPVQILQLIPLAVRRPKTRGGWFVRESWMNHPDIFRRKLIPRMTDVTSHLRYFWITMDQSTLNCEVRRRAYFMRKAEKKERKTETRPK